MNLIHFVEIEVAIYWTLYYMAGIVLGAYVNSLNLHNNALRKVTNYPHFTDEEAKAQRNSAICSGLCSLYTVKSGFQFWRPSF